MNRLPYELYYNFYHVLDKNLIMIQLKLQTITL